MRIGQGHRRVVPQVGPEAGARALPRSAAVRAHHEAAAALAAWATSTGIALLVLAAALVHA